ncbi:hypothetical protein E3T46_07640 [Cryobacterium sp. Hh11]|uniref:hypothetical protein n=1 Tax=Cryobacterium sp. Hh11 TaxID=2555868 RepID=UPI00106B25D5|nr:hypothetical protein [Cryobacterium sp. Hh11]TFD51952.1 hypothetical protein E3T46_07640 [Cryobacterium sp. Hh11]
MEPIVALTDSFPGASGAVDSTELRKNLAGLIIRDTSGIPRAGIFPRHANALVFSRVDMYLDIAAFEGVSVRGGGPLFMANDGLAQVQLAAAPASNSRIDVLYFKQNENGYGGFADGVTTAIFGVVTGTAAASPTKPSITGIAGATELATITIPSTATATNSSGVVITNTFQYTAAAGGLLLFRTTAERDLFSAVASQHGYVLANSTEYLWNSSAWATIIPTQPTRGIASFSTDASGLGSITHGLGSTPSAVILTPAFTTDTNSVSAIVKPTVGALTSTTIQVVTYRTDSSVRLTGTTVQIHWVAFP